MAQFGGDISLMFTERFNQIMAVTGASNRQIADLSGMDASSFSRLRKGQRIPRKASRTIRKISDGIYLYMDDNNRLNDLCAERLSESFDVFSAENNVVLPDPDEVVPAYILNDTSITSFK